MKQIPKAQVKQRQTDKHGCKLQRPKDSHSSRSLILLDSSVMNVWCLHSTCSLLFATKTRIVFIRKCRMWHWQFSLLAAFNLETT